MRPELFQLVKDHLSREVRTFKASHVIVEAGFEDTVRAAIERARIEHTKRERGTSKVAERTMVRVDLPDSESMDETPLSQSPPVKRTFIHIPVPSSLLSSLSTHAQTV